MNIRSRRRSSGLSLVEILVSVVILSVALIGTAQLTAASLRSTNDAYYRSQATVLADDILDRMRANVTAARNEDYDIDHGPSGHTFDPDAATGSMTLYDVTEWTGTVSAELPGGFATVDISPSGAVQINITWDGGASSFTTSSQL